MPANTKTSPEKTAAPASSTAWIPSAPGDQLEGELTSLDLGWSDYREAEYPILTILKDDGSEQRFHAFRAVPFNEVLKWKPKVGERLTIKYHGPAEKAKPGMNPAEITRIRVHGRPSADTASMYARLEGTREPAQAVEPDVPIEEPEGEDMPF